jgi:hypothetical protein
MLFRPELADAILAGKKTATRRMPSDKPRSPWYWRGSTYRVGRAYPVMCNFKEPARGHFIVDRVALERLGAVNADDARREGFESVEAFFEKFAEINGEADPKAWVWVVEFHLHPWSGFVE